MKTSNEQRFEAGTPRYCPLASLASLYVCFSEMHVNQECVVQTWVNSTVKVTGLGWKSLLLPVGRKVYPGSRPCDEGA